MAGIFCIFLLREDSLDYGLALNTAKYYGITRAEAEKYMNEIKTIISEEWQSIAKKSRVKRIVLKIYAKRVCF